MDNFYLIIGNILIRIIKIYGFILDYQFKRQVFAFNYNDANTIVVSK